jgi:predicted XRE-type DNA-binding protein
MTEDLAETIRALKSANPRMTQIEIARKLVINQGRVSEVLKGKRA